MWTEVGGCNDLFCGLLELIVAGLLGVEIGQCCILKHFAALGTFDALDVEAMSGFAGAIKQQYLCLCSVEVKKLIIFLSNVRGMMIFQEIIHGRL